MLYVFNKYMLHFGISEYVAVEIIRQGSLLRVNSFSGITVYTKGAQNELFSLRPAPVMVRELIITYNVYWVKKTVVWFFLISD